MSSFACSVKWASVASRRWNGTRGGLRVFCRLVLMPAAPLLQRSLGSVRPFGCTLLDPDPDHRENSHAFPRIDLDGDCGAVGVDSDGPGLRRCEISRPLRRVAQG